MNQDEHRRLLKEADERVLPRHPSESDAEYGERMRKHLGFR